MTALPVMTPDMSEEDMDRMLTNAVTASNFLMADRLEEIRCGHGIGQHPVHVFFRHVGCHHGQGCHSVGSSKSVLSRNSMFSMGQKNSAPG